MLLLLNVLLFVKYVNTQIYLMKSFKHIVSAYPTSKSTVETL